MLKIGVDGGGTTTRAVVIEDQNKDSSSAEGVLGIRVLGRAQAASSNHYGVGLEVAAANIFEAVHAALEAADVARTDIASFGFGLAGARTPAEQSLISNKLSSLTSGQSFVVDEDAAAAQSGAFAGGPGAVCIAGTGANCFGVNAQNERAKADGIGPLLGDRGGGYRIGEAALRAICAAEDGSGPQTSLVAPGLQAFGVASVDGLVQVVYQPDFARNRVAALFPVVLQEAQNGDAIARDLLQHAGRELALSARAVLQKLHLSRIAVVGGVLENALSVRIAFESKLSEFIPDVEVVAPQYDAAIGAALLVTNGAGFEGRTTKRA